MTKILLVEDDKSLREIYGVRLLAEGYDIVSAGDGEEALAVAIREKPELIISDVMMPKISGFEMLDLLRGNDSTKNIKVIMMTALSSEQQRERGEKLGADRYLVKSQVGIEDVVRTVHDVLGDQKPAAAAPAPAVPPTAPTPTATAQPVAPSAPPAIASTPAEPAPNQSPVNPLAATRPSAALGITATPLPPRPMSVPSVTAPMTPNIPAMPTVAAPAPLPPANATPAPVISAPQPVSAPASAAPISPAPTPAPLPPAPAIPEPTPAPSPTAPPASPPALSTLPAPGFAPPLPPIAPPPVPNAPSFQPGEGNSAQDKFEEGETAYSPAADLTQSAGGTSRVIQPTGDSLSPKINIDDLLAKEDTAGMGLNPANIAATNPPNFNTSPQLDEADVQAQLDAANTKVPPASDNNTIVFPTQQ